MKYKNEFKTFKAKMQSLSVELQSTHNLLVKEKEGSYDQHLYLDKNNAAKKAFELLSNLNELLKSDPISHDKLNEDN